MLKIYSMDGGWCGGIVVVATSKEKAFERIKADYVWDETRHKIDDIQEHDIVEGLEIEFYGDR